MSYTYRDYTIEAAIFPAGFGWRYVHNNYDGPEDNRIGRGMSLGDCLCAIDDAIADELFCDDCDSTGTIQDADGFRDECPKCQDARAKIGEAKNYPDNCPICNSQMSELYPGSGKENVRCRTCQPLSQS